MLEALRSGRTPFERAVRASSPGDAVSRPTLLSSEDLPCPWCSCPTSENDPRCPGCGRRFG